MRGVLGVCPRSHEMTTIHTVIYIHGLKLTFSYLIGSSYIESANNVQSLGGCLCIFSFVGSLNSDVATLCNPAPLISRLCVNLGQPKIRDTHHSGNSGWGIRHAYRTANDAETISADVSMLRCHDYSIAESSQLLVRFISHRAESDTARQGIKYCFTQRNTSRVASTWRD